MPDDILVFILSFLTLKEASVTSVLAKRWRYLWASVSHLSIDSKYKNVRKFVDCVNRVVRLHNGPNLYEFRVCFDLDGDYEEDIDEWLLFALSKSVERLEFNFSPDDGTIRCDQRMYELPLTLLDQSSGPFLEHQPQNLLSTNPCSLVGLKSLKSLCLNSVKLTGEVIECLLSQCPLLESLSMHGSACFGTLKFVGQSLRLKCLSMNCPRGYIAAIEICDINLVSFSFFGTKVDLLLKNVPLLTEISIAGYISQGVYNNSFGMLSCCLSQLEFFTLRIFEVEGLDKNLVVPKFPKLKHLVLEVGAWEEDRSLLMLTSLIKASPLLQKIVLQLMWVSVKPKRSGREVRRCDKCPLQYLKVVEFYGYYGRTSDLELAIYFFENAVALEKVIIDPREQYYVNLPRPQGPTPPDIIEMEQTARDLAKQQLKGKEPAQVELVIL